MDQHGECGRKRKTAASMGKKQPKDSPAAFESDQVKSRQISVDGRESLGIGGTRG